MAEYQHQHEHEREKVDPKFKDKSKDEPKNEPKPKVAKQVQDNLAEGEKILKDEFQKFLDARKDYLEKVTEVQETEKDDISLPDKRNERSDLLIKLFQKWNDLFTAIMNELRK